MRSFQPGDRVQSVCCGKYYGRTGTVRKRYYTAFDAVYYVVDLDSDQSGGEPIRSTFPHFGIVPVGKHPEERPNKAIYYS